MIGAIEQAIVDRISLADSTGVLGYRLKKVASYGNELDHEIRTVIKNFPAVWIVFKGEPKPENIGDGAWDHRPTFSVIVGVSNRRNEESSRRGAAGKVGSYQLLEDVRALIAGHSLGLDIEPLQPGVVRALTNITNASIYAQEFHTRYVSEATFDIVVDGFATFHSDWDIPPLGNVTAPLPAAENDAEDEIKPEQ